MRDWWRRWETETPPGRTKRRVLVVEVFGLTGLYVLIGLLPPKVQVPAVVVLALGVIHEAATGWRRASYGRGITEERARILIAAGEAMRRNLSLDEWIIAEFERDGWEVTYEEDGSATLIPPSRKVRR